MTTRSRPRPGALPRSATPGSPWASCRTTRAWCSTTSSPSSDGPAFPPTRDEVLTSAVAAAALLERDARRAARACSRARARAWWRRSTPSGSTWCREPPADAVVVGFHRDFDYDGLERASRAVRDGARFVATNLDATYPVPGGLIPGAGSIVAAVATATGQARGRGKARGADRRARPRASGHGRRDGGRPALDRRRVRRRARLAVRARALGCHRRPVAPPGGEAIPSPPPPYVARRPRGARTASWSPR